MRGSLFGTFFVGSGVGGVGGVGVTGATGFGTGADGEANCSTAGTSLGRSMRSGAMARTGMTIMRSPPRLNCKGLTESPIEIP